MKEGVNNAPPETNKAGGKRTVAATVMRRANDQSIVTRPLLMLTIFTAKHSRLVFESSRLAQGDVTAYANLLIITL